MRDGRSLGLVANLARPGGNATGAIFQFAELGSKQLGLLRELVPTAARIGLLMNPSNAKVVHASNILEIDAAFASLVRNRVDGLLFGTDSFFYSRRPARDFDDAPCDSFNLQCEYPEAGGLMSYRTSLSEAFRQVGIYTGRILKSEKPVDLPVVQSSKFEFVIQPVR